MKHHILLFVLPQIAILVVVKLSIAVTVAFLANLGTVLVSASSSFKVVKGFLSNSELDHFLQVKPTEKGNRNRMHGFTKIDASFVDRLERVLAAKSVQNVHNAEIKTTHLTQSSVPHIDHFTRGGVVEGDVAFVFLNDNPNAFFVHGDDRIPVVAGNMVIFRGGQVKHHTEVESGEVHLLGPFGASSLESVEMPIPSDTKSTKSAKASKESSPKARRTKATRAFKLFD
jgi:hypothetical protein